MTFIKKIQCMLNLLEDPHTIVRDCDLCFSRSL